MDPDMVNLELISQEDRVKLVRFVTEEKHVSARALGYTPQLINMVKHGRARVSDDLLKAVLRHITPEEYARVTGRAPQELDATPSDAVRVVAKAKRDPAFRDFLLTLLRQAFGDYIRESSSQYVVSEADIEEFKKALVTKGDTKRTIRDNVQYLRRALAELNWVLTPEGIRDLVADLLSNGRVSTARHMVKALKLFIKLIIKPRDPYLGTILYESVRTIRPRPSNHTRLPTLEELRAVWRALPSIEAKAYFALLSECGLRLSEPFLILMDDVDWERGVVRIGKVTETKRAFIAFLRPETLAWLKEVYLPRREEALNFIIRGMEASGWVGSESIEALKVRLLPFDQGRLRREVKEVAKQVLGRDLELYDLRKFFATHMISQGVPETIVNTLQGRAPPREYRVLVEHYWSPRHEELRQWYLRHAPQVVEYL